MSSAFAISLSVFLAHRGSSALPNALYYPLGPAPPSFVHQASVRSVARASSALFAKVENLPKLPLSIEVDNADNDVDVHGARKERGLENAVLLEAAVLRPSRTLIKKKVPIEMIWKRIRLRLSTHEDFMHVHKITAIFWVLSLMHITIVGVMHQFSDIPDSLEWSTWIALVASFFQGITGIHMTAKHRANEPSVQKGFFNLSFQMISLAYAALYLSPFAPEALNNFLIGNGLLTVTLIPVAILSLGEGLNIKQLIEIRKLRKHDEVDLGAVADISSYGVATLFGLIQSIFGLFMACNPHQDRSWLLHEASGVFSYQTLIPEQFYAANLNVLSLGVGALAITLRDKQLIDKLGEQTLVAMFALPAIFFSVHQFV